MKDTHSFSSRAQYLALRLGVHSIEASSEARETLHGLKETSLASQGCLEKAREAAAAIERRSQRLTAKLWVGMVLVCLGAAAVSVSCYSLWQHLYGEDRAAALLSRYQQLPPAKQRQVDQLLYGIPSR